jgi:hypothetical protein
MSTVHASFEQAKTDVVPASTWAKLAVAGVAVTGFWVFVFFTIIPALTGK